MIAKSLAVLVSHIFVFIFWSHEFRVNAQCDVSCDTCSGPGNQQCITCALATPYIFYDYSCGSVCSGPPDCHYAASYTCDSSCDTCSGPGPTACILCALATPYIFSDNSCGSTCSSGPPTCTYNAAYSCYSTCASCNGPLDTNCQTCSGSRYLYPDNSCRDTCDFPYMTDTVSGVQTCRLICSSGSPYYQSSASCVSSCVDPFENYAVQSINTCKFKCPQYLDTINNVCVGTCVAPFVTQTSAIDSYCNSPCQGSTTGSIYYWDGCRADYPSPLQQIDEGRNLFSCNFPCTTTTDYLYWNGTCSSTCAPFPSRTEYNRNFCDKPCPALQYFFDDVSCLTSCDSPMIASLIGGVDYCERPCAVTSFYYPELLSCNTDCPAPYKEGTTTYYKTCNKPCPESEFYIDTEECLTSCPSPMITKEINYVQQCLRPCEVNSFYYPEQLICQPNCPEPYKQNSTTYYKTCILGMSVKDLELVQSLTAMGSSVGTATTAGMTAASMASPADAGSISVGVLAKMLLYIRYMNIGYPLKLELMLKGENSSSMSLTFGMAMTPEMKAKFPEEPIPENFAKYKMHSNFLVNFWDNFTSVIIIFGATLFLRVFEFIVQLLQIRFLPYNIFRKVRTTAQNFALVMLYNNYGDIVLFYIIEMSTMDFSASFAVLSCIVSHALFLGGLCALIYHMNLLRNHQKLLKRPMTSWNRKQLDKFAKKNQGVEVLFKNFKEDSLIQEGLLFFLITRSVIFNLILALLYEHPLVQAILTLILTISMNVYLIWKRPFKKTVNLLQQLSAEILLLVVGICVVTMAIIDASGANKLDTKWDLGEAIINCSMGFKFLGPIFIVAKIGVAVYDFIQARKMMKEEQAKKERAEQMKKGKVFSRLQKPDPSIQNSLSSEVPLENSRDISVSMDNSSIHARNDNSQLYHNGDVVPRQSKRKMKNKQPHGDKKKHKESSSGKEQVNVVINWEKPSKIKKKKKKDSALMEMLTDPTNQAQTLHFTVPSDLNTSSFNAGELDLNNSQAPINLSNLHFLDPVNAVPYMPKSSKHTTPSGNMNLDSIGSPQVEMGQMSQNQNRIKRIQKRE